MPPSRSAQVPPQAEFIVNNFQETHYTHILHIEVDAGVYDCDCSEFVSFVLETVAPGHYALIAATVAPSRPLAGGYQAFLVSPTLESTGGWRRIRALSDSRRG